MRKVITKKCEICGNKFKTRTTKRTCSRDCQNKLGGFSLICVVCGKKFQHSNPRVRGCSDKCKKENSYKQQEKSHNKDMIARRKANAKSMRKRRSNFSVEKKKEETTKHRTWCKNNPDKVKVSKIKDRLNNSESYKLRSKRNKALRRKVGDFPNKKILKKRLNLFAGCCYCGRVEDLTLEHLIPISKGGTNQEHNLYGACKSCNSSKQDRDWIEWYREQSFYYKEQEREIIKLSFKVIENQAEKIG